MRVTTTRAQDGIKCGVDFHSVALRVCGRVCGQGWVSAPCQEASSLETVLRPQPLPHLWVRSQTRNETKLHRNAGQAPVSYCRLLLVKVQVVASGGLLTTTNARE